ncbi:MAG: NAD(P)-dependent alcohol dehydrogenase [Cytophagaceae bacterium]
MKAAILKKYGSAEQFQIRDVPKPEITEGQILVRSLASSVNPVDTQVRKGKLRLASGLFGTSVIGSDFCGRVEESKSRKFKVGEEVFGFINATYGHAYAEFVVVNETDAVHKPENLNYAEAASLPLVASTAFQALVKIGNIKKGDHVLINGCTGGVGSAAVQIANSYEAEVTGTCSEKHINDAFALGCKHVIDYKNDPIPQDKRYNIIFDTAGKLTFSEVENSLTDDGLLVVTIPVMKNLKTVLTSSFDILKKKMRLVVVKPEEYTLNSIKILIQKQKLLPRVARLFPIEEISQAHEMLEKESFVGKIAIEI